MALSTVYPFAPSKRNCLASPLYYDRLVLVKASAHFLNEQKGNPYPWIAPFFYLQAFLEEIAEPLLETKLKP